jgi:hypothetical protein
VVANDEGEEIFIPSLFVAKKLMESHLVTYLLKDSNRKGVADYSYEIASKS